MPDHRIEDGKYIGYQTVLMDCQVSQTNEEGKSETNV